MAPSVFKERVCLKTSFLLQLLRVSDDVVTRKRVFAEDGAFLRMWKSQSGDAAEGRNRDHRYQEHKGGGWCPLWGETLSLGGAIGLTFAQMRKSDGRTEWYNVTFCFVICSPLSGQKEKHVYERDDGLSQMGAKVGSLASRYFFTICACRCWSWREPWDIQHSDWLCSVLLLFSFFKNFQKERSWTSRLDAWPVEHFWSMVDSHMRQRQFFDGAKKSVVQS